ncbi:DUF3789 domain-containing protein [Veillonella caviae]|uniref:DUF3789 domain-containing protein n=1 Tax=Veillonella caviae TaxID=248316 RepID=UPI002A9087A4|nr:DUF3789 domain-containing protein [Veillonella caviae]MDY5787501.1 DUF3789 domain-containing protein [Veillonella caviae]
MFFVFILGALLGSSIGVMITCLCGIAKQSDERAERMLNMNHSNSQLYKQAGNAVTVNVVEEIGKHIMSVEKEV